MPESESEHPRGRGGRWVAEVIEERELTAEDRLAAGELLAEAFDYDGYREQAHRGPVPEFRVLVRDRAGRVLGQRSVFRLENSRGLVAYGMGDAAVREEARRQGIATELVDAGLEEARRRGAQAILTYTGPLAGVYARRGFQPADGRIAGDLPEHGDMALLWAAAGVELPTASDPLHVEPGDF